MATMATPVPPPPAPAAAPAQAPPPAPEVPPNQTIYINNLNEKIKKDELVNSLRAMFSQFGNILEIVACKTLKLKGQAWVVFDNVASATKAKDGMQDFPFHDKPLKIQYAKTKSDTVAKQDGTFMPKEKRKRMDERGQRKREHHDQHSYYNHQYHAPRPSLPEAPAPPNNILFVQKLPHDMTSHNLQAYFERIPGFREVRMIEAKPGIAFVEYIDENHATVAKNTFNGYRINDVPMHITYAKR